MGLTERNWGAVAPTLLTADGTSAGLVTLTSTVGIFVKQKIVIQQGSTLLLVQVKNFKDRFSFYVGDPQKALTDRTDVSAYTVLSGAFIYAEPQARANVPKDDQAAATYAEEPILARRAVLVDNRGEYFSQNNAFPISSIQLQNIEQILVQGFLGNANKFLTNENLENLYDEDGRILSEQ